MRTITVTYTDGATDLVFDAETCNYIDDEHSYHFTADSKPVAIVPARNVRHFVFAETKRDKIGRIVKDSLITHDEMRERLLEKGTPLPHAGEDAKGRIYDTSKVTVVNDHDKYGSRCITLLTPTNALAWLTGAGSEHEAARAAAIDAARELGYKTVGQVQKLGLTSDVKTGRTSIKWRAEVA